MRFLEGWASTNIFPQLNALYAAELMPGQDADTVGTAFVEQAPSSCSICATEGLGKRVTSD